MNIVFIALDTQRADHMGCYGYPLPTTPLLDSIAARGVLFDRCYAPNIPTHPSFTTMFTGKEAITHDIVNIGGRVPIRPNIRLLPEILQEAGWKTAAVDTMERHFSRGYDEYFIPQWDRSDPLSLRRAEHVTEPALDFVHQLGKGSQPFFLFLHYWDPHTPYLPPPPYRGMFYPADRDPYDPGNHSMDPAWQDDMFKWYYHDWMPGVTDSTYVNALYDAETRYMDDQLQRLFAALEPLQSETLVLVTADHGEILDEQLGFYDHHGLYEGNVRVPLFLYWPGQLPAGKRVPGFVQNLDFVPTLLEMAGLPDTDGAEGRSLLPCIRGEREGNYDEIYLSEATWQVKRSLLNQRYKYIHSYEPDSHGRPLQELFDMQADPNEQQNLATELPEVAQEMKGRIDAWVARRLAETGRSVDPVVQQGRCGTSIGTPVPGETPGAGATPLHLRHKQQATGIPAPEELNAAQQTVPTGEGAPSNTATDERTGTPLHGYVDKEN